jgi:hypothetical protein
MKSHKEVIVTANLSHIYCWVIAGWHFLEEVKRPFAASLTTTKTPPVNAVDLHRFNSSRVVFIGTLAQRHYEYV